MKLRRCGTRTPPSLPSPIRLKARIAELSEQASPRTCGTTRTARRRSQRALADAGGAQAPHRPRGVDQRPGDPRGDGRGGGRRRHPRRGEERTRAHRRAALRTRDPHSALGGVRPARCRCDDPRGRGRDRRRGLRRDAHADVPALGGAPGLSDQGPRHLLRRGSGPEVGDLR